MLLNPNQFFGGFLHFALADIYNSLFELNFYSKYKDIVMRGSKGQAQTKQATKTPAKK